MGFGLIRFDIVMFLLNLGGTDLVEKIMVTSFLYYREICGHNISLKYVVYGYCGATTWHHHNKCLCD